MRVSALCLRFICRLKKTESASGPLTVSETNNARLLWLQHTQSTHLSDCRTALSLGKPHPLVKKMNLYLDEDNLIRCRGRLENAELSMDSKYPVLVPKASKIARLIVIDCHKKVIHAGASHTLACIRQKYWITRRRSMVKSIISRCQMCMKHEGGPYRTPPMAPLPDCRTTRSNPFSHIGIDYFGPVFCKVQ